MANVMYGPKMSPLLVRQSSPKCCAMSAAAHQGLYRAGKQQDCSAVNLKNQLFIRGEGMRYLKLQVRRSCTRQNNRRQTLIPMASAALQADISPGMNEYIPNFEDKSLPLRVRAISFYMWTYTVVIPVFVLMAAIQPFVLAFDRNRRKVQHLMNRIWASLTILLFFKAEIIGRENLPSSDEGAVYVANHQSVLDIYTLLLLGRPFKFISKKSNFFIPVIGWAMFLTGHVPLRRLDKRSQMECLKKCIGMVKVGVSVLFFPEGTRTPDGIMGEFKKGAFTIATKGNVPVVPITLIGTGRLMPNGLESTLRSGKVKIIIHPRIEGRNADELCSRTRDVIAETLLKHGMRVA